MGTSSETRCDSSRFNTEGFYAELCARINIQSQVLLTLNQRSEQRLAESRAIQAAIAVGRIPVVTKEPEVVEEPVFHLSDAVAAVAQQLPNALPRVCILGGRKFQEKSSELLVKELAKAFAAELKDRALVLTGGLEGIQETFATNVGLPDQVVNMVPEGTSAEFKVGKEVHAGANLGERIQIYGQIGDIYLTIEGGPGVSKEATAASDRGAVVLPMAWSGGASSGLFDFPKKAFTKPDCFSSEEWKQVMEKTKTDESELAQSTAKIVISGVVKLIEKDLKKA